MRAKRIISTRPPGRPGCAVESMPPDASSVTLVAVSSAAIEVQALRVRTSGGQSNLVGVVAFLAPTRSAGVDNRVDIVFLNATGQRLRVETARVQRGTALTFADIQDLAGQRILDDTTLAYLRSTKTSFRLTTETFDGLRAAGVSDRVVNYLLLASPLAAARAGRIYRPAPVRGYGYRPFRTAPGFGRFGGFGGQHRGGHRGGRH